MRKETSCGCIIINDGKALLVYAEGIGFWGFPKGHMEKGETEIETAKREVKEEVGLDVIVDEKHRYELHYTVRECIDKTTVLYLAQAKNVDVKKQDCEIKETRWVPIEEVCDLLTFDNWKEMFKKVLSDIKK